MPNEDRLTRIVVSGFGYSGSTAVLDWLAEKSFCKVFPTEWDLFRQPDGLQDLRDALTDRVSNRRAYIGLKRFMYLAVTMSRPGGRVFGRDFEALAYPGFQEDVLDFANSLVAVSVPAPATAKWLEDHHIYQPAPLPPERSSVVSASLQRKIRRSTSEGRTRFLKRLLKFVDSSAGYEVTDPLAPTAILLPSPMTTEDFDAHSRRYFDPITRKIAGPDFTHLVLHHGFLSTGVKAGLGLMSNVKAIYVHRDPRDVFLSSVTQQIDVIPNNSVEDFAHWFRMTMPKADLNDPRIKVIAFEDLVQKPDAVLDHLSAFLDLDTAPGPKHRTLFDPSVSVKNSGKWRDYEDQDLMQRVAEATHDHYHHIQSQTVRFDS